MTPNDIDVLIHYHSSRSTHPRYEAQAVKQSISDFCEHGILETFEYNQTVFQTTPRGRALVAMLCNTPQPTMGFIDPRTLEVVEFEF